MTGDFLFIGGHFDGKMVNVMLDNYGSGGGFAPMQCIVPFVVSEFSRADANGVLWPTSSHIDQACYVRMDIKGINRSFTVYIPPSMTHDEAFARLLEYYTPSSTGPTSHNPVLTSGQPAQIVQTPSPLPLADLPTEQTGP